MNHATPEAVVQRQLDAYNARDLEGWLATYAPDAKQFEFPATLLTEGHEQIRTRTGSRFAEPDLHAKLLARSVMDDIVIDHELVTRNFPEGRGTIRLVCIYRVRDGLIHEASFVFGEKTLT